MTTSFTVTVHGKDLDANLTSILKATGIMWEDNVLTATIPDIERRDIVISTLSANGFKVQSSYRQGRGWKVQTIGVADGV